MFQKYTFDFLHCYFIEVAIILFVESVNLLFVKICELSIPTKVADASGIFIILVCPAVIVGIYIFLVILPSSYTNNKLSGIESLFIQFEDVESYINKCPFPGVVIFASVKLHHLKQWQLSIYHLLNYIVIIDYLMVLLLHSLIILVMLLLQSLIILVMNLMII